MSTNIHWAMPYSLPDINDVIQKVGAAKYISTFDAKSGYWQTPVRSDHQWLTAFICDAGLFEWLSTPFCMKASGAIFVLAVQQVLYPLREFTDSYVDDMAVHSNDWKLHLQHLTIFLNTIKESGFTLNIKKCNFAKSEVRFCGHIIGSGQRKADP